MERNLRLYGLYVPLASAHFWAGVFFLYFNARFTASEVLRLEAVYYAAVVLLEVPSGYFSDRIGRVPTLRISSFAAAVAYLLFLFGDRSFETFAAAQVAIAVSFSFLSGTSTSFHYDTLAGLERAEEYAAREARLQRNALLARAASVLVGGAVSVLDLRLAYALSAAAALAAFVTTLLLREPPRNRDAHRERGFLAQLGACARELRRPVLLWIFAYVVFQTTLEHVPWEFAQPYVAAVLGESMRAPERAPLVTGVVTAAIAWIGALASTRSLALRRRLGPVGALLAVTALQLAVVVSMAWSVQPWVLGMIALRSVHPAVSQVLVRAEVTPRLAQSLRATFLSLQSLVGRLGYSLVLLALGGMAAGAREVEGDTLLGLLRACSAIGVVGLVALAATRRAATEARSV